MPFMPLFLAFLQAMTPVDQAKPLLQSSSLRDKAWGAWLAGASRDPAMQAALLDQLHQAEPLRFARYGSGEYVLIGTLLDALVQIGQPVPVEALLPFETSWRGAILILLSRKPADSITERALLDIRSHSMPDPEWIALNDLLFAISSRPFFQKTLEEIQITQRFIVSETVTGVIPPGFGGGVDHCQPNPPEHGPAGFPPHAHYVLRTPLEAGDVLLLAQPVPVYFRQGNSGCMLHGGHQDRQDLLVRYLSAAANRKADDVEKLFHPEQTVRSPEEFEAVLGQQSASIRIFLADLQKRGFVIASGLRFPVRLTVADHRGDRTTPIPNIQPHEIVIP